MDLCLPAMWAGMLDRMKVEQMMTPELLEAELEMFLSRARMSIPENRREAVMAGYADFRAQMDLLHERRDASLEPANVFRMPDLFHITERGA